ncbi:hypothetical protein DsansV1_C05g0055681 [Dioscorea sansibarensis]
MWVYSVRREKVINYLVVVVLLLFTFFSTNLDYFDWSLYWNRDDFL